METLKYYKYVGPPNIKQRALRDDEYLSICNKQDLLIRLNEIGFVLRPNTFLTTTFVIDEFGLLKISDRHSEHVACASGRKVLSAGEMTFGYATRDCFIENITNQSTGYCPEPNSWPAVQSALDQIGITYPSHFDPAFCFRLCYNCKQTNLVKDNWFVCGVCNTELPKIWNFDNDE